ncbi:MAG: hypothetical protein BAA03_01960 [Caldibacillus debilis]|nr:MAG: hypothetical protein BAA03_01960 [Caldibacillus debilis]
MENIAKVAGPSLQTGGVISVPGPTSPFTPKDGRSRCRMNAVGRNMARRSGRPQLDLGQPFSVPTAAAFSAAPENRGSASRKRLSRRQRFAGREAGSLGTDLGKTAFYISIIEQMFVLFLSFFARKIRTAWPVFAAGQAVRFISS